MLHIRPFWNRSNVQQHLQITDFQIVEKESAPRRRFVKKALSPTPSTVPSERVLRTTICYQMFVRLPFGSICFGEIEKLIENKYNSEIHSLQTIGNNHLSVK